MNTIEPVLLKELNETDYESLISYRIRKILMICSNYDAFILEEDGQIESQIFKEYIDLNLAWFFVLFCFVLFESNHHIIYNFYTF